MAAPKVRGVKESKKGAASQLAVVYPTGTVEGDYAVLLVSLKKETPPTLETPAGWTLQESFLIGSAGTQRRIYLFTQKVTSTLEFTIKASGEATDIYAWIIGIEKGTFNTTTTVNVIGKWEEQASTNLTQEAVTTSTAECLAIAVMDPQITIATGFPSTGWTELFGFTAESFMAQSKTIAGAESTGSPTFTQGTAKPVAFITLAIAPVASSEFHSGPVALAVPFTTSIAGAKVAQGGKTEKANLTLQTAGMKTSSGGQTTQAGFTQQTGSLEKFAGPVVQTIALVFRTAGQKIAQAAQTQQLPGSQSTGGRKTTGAAIAQAVGLPAVTKGLKRPAAAIAQLLGLAQQTASVPAGVGGPGTVALQATATTTVALTAEATGSVALSAVPVDP